MVDYQCGLDMTLLPASYKGAPFEVEDDTEDYARRIETNDYPNRDKPYHEDMGERYAEFTVNAYVTGSEAYAKKEAIKAVCRVKGAGPLQLPAVPLMQARCLKCTIKRHKDKQGVYTIAFTFREDDGAEGGATADMPLPAFEQSIATMALDAVDSLSDAFDDLFDGYGMLGYAVDNAVGIYEAFADLVTVTLENTPLTGRLEDQAVVARDAFALYQGAPAYVQPLGFSTFNGNGGKVPTNSYGALTGSTTPLPPGRANPYATAAVGAIAGILNTFYGVLTPSDAVEVMTRFATFSVGEVVAKPAASTVSSLTAAITGNVIAPSDLKNQNNAAAINGTIRSCGLIQYARAITAVDYTDRPTAIQARADVVELFNAQIDMAPTEAVATMLTTARDTAVKCLSSQITTLARIVTVETPSSMPSLYHAHRLYGDANRADELIARNNVPSPAFMPQSFEALAR